VRFLYLAILLSVPAFAGAEELPVGGGGNYSFFASFVQMIAALAIVIGLILVTYFAATRLMRGIPALSPVNRHIRLLEVRSMGPRKSLMLIEVGGEYLLLSSTEEHLSLIKQIEMLEEIEVIDEPPQRPSFISFLKRASGAMTNRKSTDGQA
jgi:flagellar protein FliO/FliZ